MIHPYEVLKAEYAAELSSMQITRLKAVDAAVKQVEKGLDRYIAVGAALGIPAIFIGALDYRESDCDPHAGLGQGDPWNHVSTHVPRGCGPFKSWIEAAEFYLRHDHMNENTAPWSWEYCCWKGEIWNGTGYRAHGEHTPYLWGATSMQQQGKYTADGHFDPSAWDSQVGIIPVMKLLVLRHKELDLSRALPNVSASSIVPSPLPLPVPVGAGGGPRDTRFVQHRLNQLGADPSLIEDGNYGRRTRSAVRAFQAGHALTVDGLAGPQTIAALEAL